MKFNLIFLVFALLILSKAATAQEDIQIGKLKYTQSGITGFFDYSDPTGINIKVQIWGYVRFPGYYVIPARSSINDLMSLAGGPSEEALLDDVRILRTGLDSTATMYKYNYNDLLWDEELNSSVKFPRLVAGDMVLIPGEPRYFARQDVGFFLSIVTALASVISAAAIIISVTK